MLFELSYSFLSYFPVFFFDDTATTEIYTLSLHDALPISSGDRGPHRHPRRHHDPPTPVVMMRWISARRSSTPVSSFGSGSRSGASAISASSARKSSCVWTTSQTPWTSVYSYSDEPCRLARSAR